MENPPRGAADGVEVNKLNFSHVELQQHIVAFVEKLRYKPIYLFKFAEFYLTISTMWCNVDSGTLPFYGRIVPI